MRVFVTGATGFIGTAVVKELIGAGHHVIGLTRSAQGAKRLSAAGVEPLSGTLHDLQSLRRGAGAADAVIHLAFIHGFTDAPLSARLRVIARGLIGRSVVSGFMSAVLATDRIAIETLAQTLGRSDRPLVLTVGTMGLRPGRLAIETDPADPNSPGGARSVPTERAAAEFSSRGVRATVVRLPPSVHGDGRAGLVSRLIEIARRKGRSVRIGDGANRWGAVHRLDVARLYLKVLEQGAAGDTYHGVAEEGVHLRDIARLIGRRLDVPVVSQTEAEAARSLSWLAPFVSADNPVSSQQTQQQLDWHPRGPSLLYDIDQADHYGMDPATPRPVGSDA